MDVNTYNSNTVIFEQSSAPQKQAEPQRTANNAVNNNKQPSKANDTQYNANRVNYSQYAAEYRDQRETENDKVKAQFDALERAIADANKQISGLHREFRYDVHTVTKDIMIKIIDSQTEEVIREIPPKKTLDAIAKMWELAGIIVDEKR